MRSLMSGRNGGFGVIAQSSRREGTKLGQRGTLLSHVSVARSLLKVLLPSRLRRCGLVGSPTPPQPMKGYVSRAVHSAF